MPRPSLTSSPESSASLPILDESQLRVLELELGQSRAIIGAPGSGKTTALLALYRHLLRDRGLRHDEVLALGANRIVATQLRAELDALLDEPAGGPRARTSSSFALALLSADRRVRGELPLRLLTGSVQDEIIERIARLVSEHPPQNPVFTRDVLGSPLFRNQFRELLRVLDETQLGARDLARLGEQFGVPEWSEVSALVTEYRTTLENEYPLHRDTSSLHLEAATLLDSLPVSVAARDHIGELAALRVVLVDDAQELTASTLQLLRAIAARGVTVWAFGDPDISTGAFQGSAHRALSDLGAALGVQSVEPLLLSTVYRHPATIRSVVQDLTEPIGAAGLGEQRRAEAFAKNGGVVQRARFPTTGESVGAIAHLLRERHLGLGQDMTARSESVDWSDMAVITRTRHEAQRLARQLSAAQVPTDISAGGAVLAEHPVIRDLLTLVQFAYGWRTPDTALLDRLLTGPLGGVDVLALKRLRMALQLADARTGDARPADELMLEHFLNPLIEPRVDTRQSRALVTLAKLLAAASARASEGGDLSEVLWEIWATSPLPQKWERQALSHQGTASDEANASLDAVMALFFASARFEEQEVTLNRAQFVESLLGSSVPEDSLARARKRAAVTVTTPQGMIGRQAKIVVVTQLQDGTWPNLKSRGSLLHLERLSNVASGAADAPIADRRDVLHDELRLFAQAVSRASDEVLITAVQNDDTMPSVFFTIGSEDERTEMPSGRLTLRGLVASLRRSLHEHPDDKSAAEQLAILALNGVPGANPDEWFGMRALSTEAPLHDLSDGETLVSVSPSRLEKFENCALDWAIARLGGERSVSSAALGTLLHLAMETVEDPTVDAVMARVDDGWSVLSFDSAWEQTRTHDLAESMAESLVAYLDDFEAKGGTLIGAEQQFRLNFGQARVRGTIDRIELTPRAGDEPARVLIVDLKTQKAAPGATEIAEHPQLALYQLAAQSGEIEVGGAELAGAALLLVHPKAKGSGRYKLPTQAPLTEEQRDDLVARLEQAAVGMSAATFTAKVEHHCTDNFAFGNCKIHIVRPVSFG